MILAQVPSRTDYVDEVYRTLLDAISDGTLAPGVRVKQEDLADQLNVSRSPVLQALRLLKKDGLLEDAPGRGLLVTRLEPLRVGQLYRMRGSLDALAARLAAEFRAEIPAALISAGRQAAAGSDVRAMIEADTAFHRAIYAASGNPYIVDSAVLHWIHVRRVMGAVLLHGEGRAGIWDEHEAICAAIRTGDGALAAALSEGHADKARQSLVHSLKLALRLVDCRAGSLGQGVDGATGNAGSARLCRQDTAENLAAPCQGLARRASEGDGSGSSAQA